MLPQSKDVGAMKLKEIRQTLEQILVTQQTLQSRQMQQQADINRLIELIERLIGYAVESATQHLTLEERLSALEVRKRRLADPDDLRHDLKQDLND